MLLLCVCAPVCDEGGLEGQKKICQPSLELQVVGTKESSGRAVLLTAELSLAPQSNAVESSH